MSPHRDARGYGTLILDQRCGKLGRLKVASGTLDAEVYGELKAMLRRLTRERRWDLLQLLQQRHVKPLELYDALGRGTMGELPTAEDVRPLKTVVARALPELDIAESTRAQYQGKFDLLLKDHQGATLVDLPGLLRRARTAALASGQRVGYNRLRAACFSVLRQVLRPDHPILRDTRLVPALEEDPRPGNPQTPDQVRQLVTALGSLGPIAWALALTGMRQDEYFAGRWTVLSNDRVQVQGTKSKRSRRLIPLVYPIAPPTVGYKPFLTALREVSEGAVQPHDLRKTFSKWGEDAGVPNWRIERYMGHSLEGKLDALYRMPLDPTAILQEDAARYRTHLGDRPPEQRLDLAVNA